jgi:hypothetical protein
MRATLKMKLRAGMGNAKNPPFMREGTRESEKNEARGNQIPRGGSFSVRDVALDPALARYVTTTHGDGQGLTLRAGAPTWIVSAANAIASDAAHLFSNGARQAALGHINALGKVLRAESEWANEELDVTSAAREADVCEETIRRRIRSGALSDNRTNARGRHRIRRSDLAVIERRRPKRYSSAADAQDIAQRRRAE